MLQLTEVLEWNIQGLHLLLPKPCIATDSALSASIDVLEDCYFLCLPAPLGPILSLPWFCCLEVLQHSFGDWGGVELQAWLLSRFPKVPVNSMTAACCLHMTFVFLHMTLSFSKHLGAGVWYLWELEVWTMGTSHCCGECPPALLSSVSVPRSSGRSWSREELPRLPNLSRFNLESSSAAKARRQEQAQGESFALHPFLTVSGDFSSGLLAPQTHRSVEDFHESTNHQSLFNFSYWR